MMCHTNPSNLRGFNGAVPHITGPSEYPEPPEQLVEYFDERLQRLQVVFWTDIEVSNDFAARVISVYMVSIYQDFMFP